MGRYGIGGGVILLAALTAVGCSSGRGRPGGGGGGGDGDGGGTADDGGASARTDGGRPPPSGTEQCTKMDVLFIVDDSGSMAEEQANLAANFPGFVEVLNGYRTETGEPLDYRLGVTTTGKDVTTIIEFGGSFGFPPMEFPEEGPNGELIQGCGMTRKWIESSDPDVSGTFSCVARVGTSGSSVEMPLYALELALTDRVADGKNAGFLREDALLAVVVLTDEDDCSRLDDPITITIDDPFSGGGGAAVDECDPENPAIEPASRFLTAYDAVKGDRGRWAMAVIAGETSCTSDFGSAAEARRLQQFVESAGDNAVFSSICEGDLTAALTRAIDTFQAACETFPPLI